MKLYITPGSPYARLARMDPPLRLLEGLIIPKSMKGGREAWVFILLISLFAGLGMLIEGGVTGLGVGTVLVFLGLYVATPA